MSIEKGKFGETMNIDELVNFVWRMAQERRREHQTKAREEIERAIREYTEEQIDLYNS